MRSHRPIWLWLGGLFLTLSAFLTAIAIAYFTKESHYSLFANPWMPGALVSFVAAFAAFFAAAQSWAFPSAAKAGFPRITIDIYSIGSTDTEREASSGLDVLTHLRSFNARFANAEQERSASLTATMYVKLVAGSWGRAGEAVCPPPTWTLPPSLGLSPMNMPLDLGPGKDVAGQLLYEIPRYYLNKIASPPEARLEITDHVSGKRVSIPAELGHYDKTTMTAVSGGAEILGPEFEPLADTNEDQRPGPAMEQA